VPHGIPAFGGISDINDEAVMDRKVGASLAGKAGAGSDSDEVVANLLKRYIKTSFS